MPNHQDEVIAHHEEVVAHQSLYEAHGAAAIPSKVSTTALWARRLAILIVVAASFSVGITLIIGGRARAPPPPPTMPELLPFSAPGCNHPIFCQGALLRAVQMTRVFNDSKFFVDCPIKSGQTPETVLTAFSNLSQAEQSDRDSMVNFVNQFFDNATAYIQRITPTDYNDAPAFLKTIQNSVMRSFGQDVHRFWLKLVRQFDLASYCANCTSAIAMPYPFVVPGDRFREFYYWDSWWIMEGLLVSGLTTTARDVVENFLHLVATYGFVPNGARLYYLDRSQPPVLPLVVWTYINATGGPSQHQDLLARAIPLMVEEQDFWWTAVNTVDVAVPGGTTVRLFRYATTNTAPRPESYFEDVQTSLQTQRNASDLYRELAAGAETGWDFSTRWFQPGSEDITTIMTSHIVPVDLNAILLRGSEIIAELAAATEGFSDIAANFTDRANIQRTDLVSAFRASAWRDLVMSPDFSSWSPRTGFYASIAVAAWVPSITAELTPAEQEMIGTALKQQLGIGGLKTSDTESGQQWDGTNAWPPLQYFAHEALRQLGMGSDASVVAQRYIQTTYCGLQTDPSGLREKYNASIVGQPGSGGEYPVQTGFGWSNGVLLHFLAEYGATAGVPKCTP